jgi:hypothetical protein
MSLLFQKLTLSRFYWFPIPIVYIINLLAKDIQEDSWITFRTAFNIADNKQWSYNLGDAYSSTTSFAYPILVALIRKIFGSSTIVVVLVINSIVVLAAVRVLIQILNRVYPTSPSQKKLIFVLLSIQPISLLLSGKGMETIYLILLTLISISYLQQNEYRKSICIASLAIFIRPDAFVYTVAIGLYIFYKRVKHRLFYVHTNLIVVGSYLILNKILTQDWLPATISAKHTSYSDSILSKVSNFLIRPQIETFAPITTKFIPDTVYKIVFITVIVFFLAILFLRTNALVLFKNVYIYILMFISIFPIFLYGLMTSVFPWYTWPSRFIFQSSLIYLVIVMLKGLKFRALVIIFVLLSSFVQLAISANTGIRYEYRISIGKYIHNNSLESDVLVLEPAGQIPFYSGLKTIDTVGLTNSAAIDYQNEFGESYLQEMLMDLKPRWVLFPASIEKMIPTIDDYPDLNQYVLDQHFQYRPEDFSEGFVLQIARFGTLNDDLFLYRLD